MFEIWNFKNLEFPKWGNVYFLLTKMIFYPQN